MRHPTRRSSALGAVVLAGVVLVGVQPVLESTAAPVDAAVSADRLVADATGEVHVTRGTDGVVDFVGAAAGTQVTNPGVTASSSVRGASLAHLGRYGAALGLDRPGTTLAYAGRAATASRQDVVRYDQRVGGVPVIGGQVVVTLRADRQLGSMLSTVSDSPTLPAATSSEDAGAVVARDAVAAATGLAADDLPVAREGRWLWDPAVLGSRSPAGARGVWRFEVGDGVSALHTVLVDDRTGAVLLDVDDQQSVLDRVVCDRANVRGAETTCTSGFARTEGGAASGVADVNAAFLHAGETSDFYAQVAGVDLTQLLGVNVGGQPKLAATVRFCRTTGSCPYANAFWNGTQMFYGAGYAGADDVVGHEMTHGVIDRNADLFYWGQSGAINESLADIMGEIVDRRNTLDGNDATWPLGEDIPGGAIRNLSNPPALGQPDRMTSALWDADTFGYGDNGGVHTNSGVGNKAAYLISQGGTFNGQTITGIDGMDPTLTKTAALYYEVILRLTSGSDYANLADVLEQACGEFVANDNQHGFNTGDCTNVAKAVTATQLRTTPTQAPQPADAARTCPTGTFRLLFDSEAGVPSASFSAGARWTRLTNPVSGGNATSGHDSWYADDPAATSVSPLTLATPITLPAGQPTYLWFQQWRLLGYQGSTYYDGGTVEVDNTADAFSAYDGSALSWVNGPTQNLAGAHTGRKGFAADSFGWVASRVDLSGFNGSPVRPQFTMRSQVGGLGWWLDDIAIYTCDGGTITAPPLPPPPTTPATPTPTPAGPTPTTPTATPTTTVPKPSVPSALTARGGLGRAVVSWQPPTTNAAQVIGYQVTSGDTTIGADAGGRKAVFKGLQNGKTYTFAVVAFGVGGYVTPAATVTANGTAVTLRAAKSRGKTRLTGALKMGPTGVDGQVVKVLAKQGSRWVKVGKTTTVAGGKYSLRLKGTTQRKYRVVFLGGANLMGSRSPQRHL